MRSVILMVMTLAISSIFEIKSSGGEVVRRETMLPWTSQEYKDKIRTWKYSPEDAYALCVAYEKANAIDGVRFSRHMMIVDDCYLFSANVSKVDCRINLRGYYVNGKTGDITFRGEGVLLEDQQVQLWKKACGRNYPLKK